MFFLMGVPGGLSNCLKKVNLEEKLGQTFFLNRHTPVDNQVA
jgi:hypothetical protein